MELFRRAEVDAMKGKIGEIESILLCRYVVFKFFDDVGNF